MRLACNRVRLAAIVLAPGILIGCAEQPAPPSPEGPGAAAMNLFVVAGEQNRPAELDSVFDPVSLATGEVALLDALDALAGSPPPELTGVHLSEGEEEAFVDLDVELPGGGRASYNLKLTTGTDGGWRIAWFQGPGVEWPPSGGRGNGLTTSVPPGVESGG